MSLGTLVALLVILLLGTAQAAEIRIDVGDDAPKIVREAPLNSTFVFAAGQHFIERAIQPRDGDRFIGEEGAILTGAIQLPVPERVGDMWVVEGLPRPRQLFGRCQEGVERCDHPEDLFVDERPLRHVATLAELSPGTWHHDTGKRRLYMGMAPEGALLEMSIAPGAFVGNAQDVVIENLTIEKFAVNVQRGAVHAYSIDPIPMPGTGWTIRNSTIRLNHGIGIAAGYGAIIEDNTITWNGQMGILSVGGYDTRVVENEIGHNNFAGFRFEWAAGGAKFIRTSNLLVEGNHVHHNDGPGLWTDIDNIDTVFRANLVEYNTSTGIFHEISYRALISDNVVRYNALEVGEVWYAYVFGSGILVYNSSNVEVTRNVVIGNWNGVNGLMHDRGGGAFGSYDLRNLHVHNNVIHLSYNEQAVGPGGGPGNGEGMQAVTGISQNDGMHDVYSEEYNNRFEHNRYFVEDPMEPHWTWADRRMTFTEWQVCDLADRYWPGCTQDVWSFLRVVSGPEDIDQDLPLQVAEHSVTE